ncbi:MAG: bifunctional phosphoribosylaminoimidazolecarboxamide formyltransferase/IMP cyclohydrolase [Peptococcaceae bacterium]|jgi:phosphoribosylaminoimidazolecarboxamide formyltransferase/IMP cyclohydrolase|nr:bifunctional phosphoribosylaminoimidazolecarboxamide formyltransferase/IMP cyclohydrolase [Peptococcaceae bacterium]
MASRRAIISVSDKTGILEFAKELVKMDFELVSTGGTYQTIKEAGIPVTYVSEVTGFPEILDGRVKTLNPRIHGGILAMRTPEHLAQLEEHNITPIDLVVVNLYPFRQTISKPGVELAEAIENIDIGGPSMIRAAAKNYQYVTVVTNPGKYQEVLQRLQDGAVDEAYRLQLSAEAFRHTAEYDTFITTYLQKQTGIKEDFPDNFLLLAEKRQELRYGENAQQRAALYSRFGDDEQGVGQAVQLTGLQLSYNNTLDLDAAMEVVREFAEPAATIIKHTNPCGVGLGADIREAWLKAYEGDTLASYGGIVAVNREVDVTCALEMNKVFLEAIIAPSFSEEALAILAEKPKLRLLTVAGLDTYNSGIAFYPIKGGLLLQEMDTAPIKNEFMRVMTHREPTPEEIAQMQFAMTVAKHVKSNAVVLAKDYQVIGVGAGQMSRISSVDMAFNSAQHRSFGAVMASDAFFTFRDTVDACAKHGITAIVQPGGSIYDAISISAANEANIAMVFTGVRHFHY